MSDDFGVSPRQGGVRQNDVDTITIIITCQWAPVTTTLPLSLSLHGWP